jgi:hypothetical protein
VESLPAVLPYLDPEVPMPVLSFIAAVSGLYLTIGGAPLRAFKRWLGAR